MRRLVTKKLSQEFSNKGLEKHCLFFAGGLKTSPQECKQIEGVRRPVEDENKC